MTRPIDRDSVAAARALLDQMTGEIPSSDGESRRGGSQSDGGRTASLAFRDRIDPEDDRVGHLADVARAGEANIDRLMRIIIDRARQGQPVARQVAQLNTALDEWQKMNPWSEQNLRRATLGLGNDGCVDCARVPGPNGHPIYSDRHTRSTRCQQCLAHLRRVRLREGHEDDETCPRVLIMWRERNAGKGLRDDIMDALLEGKLQP